MGSSMLDYILKRTLKTMIIKNKNKKKMKKNIIMHFALVSTTSF